MTKEQAFAETIDAFSEATLYAFCIALALIVLSVLFVKRDE